MLAGVGDLLTWGQLTGAGKVHGMETNQSYKGNQISKFPKQLRCSTISSSEINTSSHKEEAGCFIQQCC